MIPVLTGAEMAAVDRAAPESATMLIDRAGAAVAWRARSLLGGAYTKRVLVVVGKGNNGADGHVAAMWLSRWGARCDVVTPAEGLAVIGPEPTAVSSPGWVSARRLQRGWDLVIDAAYGTGLRDPWGAADPPTAPVLAVDIPSGVHAATGEDLGSWPASVTVTFGALKPGLLLHPGATRAGLISLAPIGLDCSAANSWLLTDADAAALLPQSPPTAHKWQRSVRVVAGSPQMSGAAHLLSSAALTAGAGMVVVSSPGVPPREITRPVEAVVADLRAASPDTDTDAYASADSSDPSADPDAAAAGRWADAVLADIDRFDVLAVGPGLGTDTATLAQIARLVERCPLPVVADADAVTALASHPEALRDRTAPTVLTPHDGEFARLAAAVPGIGPLDSDRFAAVRRAARALGAVVLLKGPTTLVASPLTVPAAQAQRQQAAPSPGNPENRTQATAAPFEPQSPVFVVTSGNQRLATAGAGDVLTGVIAAVLSAAPAAAAPAPAPAPTPAVSHGVPESVASSGQTRPTLRAPRVDSSSASFSTARGSAAAAAASPTAAVVAAAAHWHGRTAAADEHDAAAAPTTPLLASAQVAALPDALAALAR